MAFSSSAFILLLFFFFFLNSISAQTYANISLGTTFSPLSPPTSWPSPSGDFSFGFRPLDTDPSLFLLAVWYAKVSNLTVVWTANRDNPVSNRSTAELTTAGHLSLKDPTGHVIWNTNANTATSASMLDTGNLVLSNEDTGIVWQTFDNPTDTILPGQSLTEGTRLYARLMDNDYSTGRWELTLQDDGNLVMYPVAYPTKNTYAAYWATGTFGTGYNLVLNESGSLDVVSANNSRLYSVLPAPEVSVGAHYVRATLDPDGIFRQYTYLKSSKLDAGSWTMKNSTPSDICNINFPGNGSCGFNSYCTPDAEGKSLCQCPPHYSYVDPTKKFMGCKPDFSDQSCEPGGEATFDFTPVDYLNWPSADDGLFSPMNETECTDSCLKDCLCMVAIYLPNTNTGTCYWRKFPLSNGKMFTSNVAKKVFLKYSNVNNTTSSPSDSPQASPPSDSSRGRTDWKIWAFVFLSVLACFLLLNLALVGASCFLYRQNKKILPPHSNRSAIGPSLRSFTYKELEQATKGFSEELGKGAFGTVYKGVLQSQPTTLIAVKKLEESLLEEAESDFMNEVATIAQTHHKNLVRLLGFCNEASHRLMVFECMSKGSLSKFLFGSVRPEWNQRVQIVQGVAAGLAYLHEECRTQIIHCDIKPQNILLDDDLQARISDFGLAKLLRLDQTRTSTGIRGTIGYFAPEWFKNVAVTTKVDVYSFGVMLLEIVCCRRNLEWGKESQTMLTVIDWSKDCYRNGRLDLLVQDDEEAKMDGLRLERLVMVGICCVQEEPWLRPSMKKVVQMLEGAIAVPLSPDMYSVHT